MPIDSGTLSPIVIIIRSFVNGSKVNCFKSYNLILFKNYSIGLLAV